MSALLLAACSTPPAQPGASSAPSGAPSTAPSGAAASAAPSQAPAGLNGASVEVLEDGKALKVEQKLADNDYGYTRDFVFGKYVVGELAGMPDDEVGVMYTDGNLYNNDPNVKIRLNLSKGRIYEASGKNGSANHPGTATKELSADKNTLVKYVYEGKLIDTATTARPQTAQTYKITIQNLKIARKP